MPDARGCRLWLGQKNSAGYGWVKRDGRKVFAHRLSLEWASGPLPAGALALHSCDTPACVNPDHLRAGTERENHTDKVAKGRQARGARNGRAKLTEAEARTILARRDERAAKVAREFRISARSVRLIWAGTNWSHLQPVEVSR